MTMNEKQRIKDSANPISAFANPHFREHVADADVIWGVQTPSGEPTLFYGDQFLEGIIKTGRAKTAKVIAISYDPATTELEFLVAAVTELKGSHCYKEDCSETPGGVEQ
jgi:hypothetical protein